MVGFSSISLFNDKAPGVLPAARYSHNNNNNFLIPRKKTGAIHQGWNDLTKGIDHLTRRRIQGAGIVKDWEDKPVRGAF